MLVFEVEFVYLEVYLSTRDDHKFVQHLTIFAVEGHLGHHTIVCVNSPNMHCLLYVSSGLWVHILALAV